MGKLTFETNNNGTLDLIQNEHNGEVLISSTKEVISPGDMVMLVNLYRYIKTNNIQNEFINPYVEN